MTSLLNVLSRPALSFAGAGTAGQMQAGSRSAAGGEDAEFQAVFATIAILLAGGVAVVVAALSHAF